MNLARKQVGNLAKNALNGFAEGLFEKHIPSIVRPQGVLFSMNLQVDLVALGIQILLLIVGVATIAIELTTGWQIELYRL